MSTKSWYRDVAHALDEMGIHHEFKTGRKHTKVLIERNGKKAILVISASPSDSNCLKLVKGTARRLMW